MIQKTFKTVRNTGLYREWRNVDNPSVARRCLWKGVLSANDSERQATAGCSVTINMSGLTASTRPEQPHLVSLVLQSKKALQHGEQLCSRARSLSNKSAQCAVDVLALDAKVKWISDAVLEQLKVGFQFNANYWWTHNKYGIQACCKCRKEHRAEARTGQQTSRGRLHSKSCALNCNIYDD